MPDDDFFKDTSLLTIKFSYKVIKSVITSLENPQTLLGGEDKH